MGGRLTAAILYARASALLTASHHGWPSDCSYFHACRSAPTPVCYKKARTPDAAVWATPTRAPGLPLKLAASGAHANADSFLSVRCDTREALALRCLAVALPTQHERDIQ